MSDDEFNHAAQLLKPFAKKNILRAGFHFYFTILLVWSSIAFGLFLFETKTWIVFITIPITTVFMCRSYVLEHDAGHYNLFRNKKINDIAGNIVGFGIMIPFSVWRYIHDSHHMHVGNLDKRGLNPEVWTMTVREFRASSKKKQLFYRMMRSRFGRLIITPTLNFGIAGRLIHPKYSREAIASVLVHNILYVFLLWYLLVNFSFSTVFFSYILPLIFFFGVAAFTLYGQHQFEDTYWKSDKEWSWKHASMHGSTNLQAPKWFRWIVGNVLHHSAHHINPNIPSYHLHNAQLELIKVYDHNTLPVREVWCWLDLALWDEDQEKLISFKKAHHLNPKF